MHLTCLHLGHVFLVVFLVLEAVGFLVVVLRVVGFFVLEAVVLRVGVFLVLEAAAGILFD